MLIGRKSGRSLKKGAELKLPLGHFNKTYRALRTLVRTYRTLQMSDRTIQLLTYKCPYGIFSKSPMVLQRQSAFRGSPEGVTRDLEIFGEKSVIILFMREKGILNFVTTKAIY